MTKSELCRLEQPELMKLIDEGKLVYLPCKIGDKVKVDARTWGNSWDFKKIEYGKFLVGEIISIVKTKKQTLMKIQVEHNVSWKRERKRYPVSAIGETVFITKEEAEQKLKESEKNK